MEVRMADSRIAASLVALALATGAFPLYAQSQLNPPKPAGQPPASSLGGGSPGSTSGGANDLGSLKPPVKRGAAAAAPTPAAPAAQGATKAPALSTARFQTIEARDRVVDLRTANNSEVLVGKSGRTITVERVKRLQGLLESRRAQPLIIAKPGQSLASLAAAPAGTRVMIKDHIARTEDLKKFQGLRARLATKRVPKPLPDSALNAGKAPNAVVGEGGITLADALKRPGTDIIQIGSRKYSADQLRQIDAALRASPREPKGLVERAGTGKRTASAAPPGPVSSGPRVMVSKSTSIQGMLAKPDNTVLQAPNGKTITVAQLKEYMAREKLTPAQMTSRFKGAK